jgi:hypothetical protein
VLAATLNLQGGYPLPHTRLPEGDIHQRWDNSAFTASGRLKDSYRVRLSRIIEAADRLQFILIIGLFYFGQNHKLKDERAVRTAVEEAVGFLHDLDRGNILIEVNNECDLGYVHALLQPHRVHEAIQLARKVCGGRYLVSTSYRGGSLPDDEVLGAADFVLLHGNGQDPRDIEGMVAAVRTRTSKPIVFNEDSTSLANCRAAWKAGASWGYYDQGANDYHSGFQSPPTNWRLTTPEKREFFDLVSELVSLRGEKPSSSSENTGAAETRSEDR